MPFSDTIKESRVAGRHHLRIERKDQHHVLASRVHVIGHSYHMAVHPARDGLAAQGGQVGPCSTEVTCVCRKAGTNGVS